MAGQQVLEIQLAFEAHLTREGKHLNTIRSYANDLRQFSQWCGNTFGEEFALTQLTRSDVQRNNFV